jgi:hypothetical protein
MAKYFRLPFAVTGDRSAVADVSVDGVVAYDTGYGEEYSLPRLTDPNARTIEREKQNQVFYDITLAVQQYQQFSAPDFINTSDNNGTPFSYSKDAMVRYNDGASTDLYVSLSNSNVSLPTNASFWRKFSDPLSAIYGGTGFSSYAVGDILYASTTTALSKLADVATGNALISGGVSTAPLWGKIGLGTHVSGNLPVANLNNGTGASATTFWRGDATWAVAGDMLKSVYDSANVNEQLVGLSATQTLTNKTLTQPTLTLKQSASPAPTAEGVIEWDTNDDRLVVGDGTAQKIFYPVESGSFTGTCTGAITGTVACSYVKIGTTVIATFASRRVAGASSATPITISGMPAAIIPVGSPFAGAINVTDNGSDQTAPGNVRASSGGTFIIYRTYGATSFTSSAATTGFYGFTCTYDLA